MSISRKVADQLGIEWHYVEYKSGEFSSIIDKDEFKRYSLFSQNYNTIPHVQDYIAVKTLKGRGILKSQAFAEIYLVEVKYRKRYFTGRHPNLIKSVLQN